jgi:hypothetical protein
LLARFTFAFILIVFFFLFSFFSSFFFLLPTGTPPLAGLSLSQHLLGLIFETEDRGATNNSQVDLALPSHSLEISVPVLPAHGS